MNPGEQEKLMRSLSKALSEEGVKKLSPTPKKPNQGGGNPHPPPPGGRRRISVPGKPPMGRQPIRAGTPTQEVPVRTNFPKPRISRVCSVPRPTINPSPISAEGKSVSPRKQPPLPPPRNKTATPDLTELPKQNQKKPLQTNSPKQPSSDVPNEEEPSSSETEVGDGRRPIPRYPLPIVPTKSNLMLKKDNEHKDPEDFYRSVRKLTQYPIAASDRGSIRVLQLEGMDGVAWSRFEAIFEQAAANEPEEMSSLFDLHQYDYEVCSRKRVVDKEHQQFLGTLLEDPGLNSFSRECVLCFLNNWKIVKGSLFDHSLDKGSGSSSRRIVTVNVDKSKQHSIISPRDEFSSSQNLNTKPERRLCAIEPHIFNQSTEEAVTAIKEAMETHLPKHLFKSLHGEIEQDLSGDTASYSYLEQCEPFNFDSTTRLAVECHDLKFTAAIEEPYYCSIALYDIKLREKLCETFHFELNQEEFFKLFKKGTSIFCSVTKCLIPLGSHSRTDTYLVLRIDKLLSSDIEKDFSRYQKKPGKKSGSSNPPWDQWKDTGFIRQPFVWAAVALYDDGKLLSGTTTIDEFFPIRNMWTEDYIYDQLTRDSETGKKGKTIPGSMVLDIELLTELPPMSVDSSLNFITPTQSQSKLVKEVEWFGSKNYPFLNYVNNLYVYPQSVVVKHHHPNIRVKVELLGDDNYPNSKPLGVIYTPWGGKPFCREGYTSLCAKEKRPIFADEIKIQLPGVLTEKHHILFTILNSPNDEVLGYAYTPVFSATHGVIKNALKPLVIEPQLEAGYLTKEVEPVKISETKKPYLCFKTCIISSIYPESNALFSLSHVLTKSGMVNYDGNPEQVLQVIQRLPSALCISFFPAILNCLFKLIASGDNTLAPLAVIGVISVLTKVTQISNEKSTKCNSMLLSYVRYIFDPILTASSTVHDSLVKYWCDFIDAGRPEVKNLGQGEIWILLNIVLKSSIIKLCEMGPPTRNARLTMFAPSYAGSLEKLVLSLFCVKTEIRNMDVLTMVPLFMKDLLGIIDRGVVFEMIFGYICWLNSENQSGDLFLATVKFTFIKIITNYKYYVPLNLPTEISITSKDTSEVVQQFWTKHFFAGLIVREVRAGLLQKQRIREQSIALLLDLLHSHDVDPRYSDLKKKTRIVGLYFPFVITCVEFHQVLEDYLVSDEKINWLLCFFYIVENCSRTLLHQWWDSCDAERNAGFFKLLEMASIAFKGHSLYTPLCFIMVDMILDYITTYEEKLQQPNNIELPQIFCVLQELQHNQTVGFVVALYNLLAAISKLFSKTIFCQPNSNYCCSLTYQVLFHCNSEKLEVRNKACTLFYYLLKKNFEETNDVERMKLQSTISLCRLLSCEQKVKGYSNLRNSLTVVRDYGEKDENTTLKELIVGAVHQVSRLLRFNEQLAENDQNPQVMAELFLKIANSYFHTPNLHMTWLEALSAHHKKCNNWIEAALVHTQLACIQVEYFLRVKQFPVDFFAFRYVFPECNLNTIPEDTIFAEDEFASCTLENVIGHIRSAIELLQKAGYFELVLVLYSMLAEIYTAQGLLPDLAECLAQYSQATTSLIKANKDTRLFSTYFRVVFFGKPFGEENGRQFIYRMDAKENLMTVQQFLKNVISKTYGTEEDKIEVLGNQAIDKSSLKDDVFYLQVASVTPYKEDAEEKLSPFQYHVNVDKFLFESSIGKGDEQSKKKTFFKVAFCFPYINSRLEITETEEIVLTPLESAIDLIEDRVAKFKTELNVGSHHDVRINQLQQLLQGSVVPMVNEGPLKICEAYLSKGERDKHPPEQIAKLEEAMTDFIKLCGFGVKLVNQVIELRRLSEYEQFQEMIEKHYKILREKLKQYLTE